jgi:CheY-like chemotaxis protein/HPt (histidine-containing phosphotransfer) domain-containing protein
MQTPEKKIRFLVVDDSDIVRQSLRNFFADYNIEVITCYDGLEGIQKASEYKPNLIFLDLMMPNFDGIKMLQVLKAVEELKDIPVIVISGNTNKTNVMTSLEAGAEKVISKPLEKEVIINCVKEVLGNEIFSISHKLEIKADDENEMYKEFQRTFVEIFAMKKNAIKRAIDSKNKIILKSFIHEIKGTGNTIGYPQLTDVSADIENDLIPDDVDWQAVKLKCDYIFVIIDEMKRNLTET